MAGHGGIVGGFHRIGMHHFLPEFFFRAVSHAGTQHLHEGKTGMLDRSTNRRATPLGSPEKPRAMKLAPDANATASGAKGLTPVPPGAILLSQSAGVVGEGWRLVMP